MGSSHKRHLMILSVLSLLGVLVATLSGLSHSVGWLATLCSGFGDGCRETAEYSLIGIPVWVWGVIFYLLAALLLVSARSLLFWVVAAGFGMELGLAWIMFSTKTVCVFCMANFLVIAAMAFVSFEKARFWQALSVTLATLMLSNLAISRHNGMFASTSNIDRTTPALAAAVAGQVITYDELVQPVSSRIYDLQEQIYRIERDRLDTMVAKIVLEKEAEKYGKPLQDFLKDFVASRTIVVDDQEVTAYYVENRSRWGDWKGSEQELLAQIKSYLQQQKMQQAVFDHAKSLGPQYGLEVYLREPRSPVIQVSIGKDDPVTGPDNAPVTIVEFSDYQCPACKKNHEVIRELKQTYKDRIKWVFKDFPMPNHKWARGAAGAAHCAAEQGRFWEYQDLLFSSQEELTPVRLNLLAKDLGLDMDTFTRCIEAGRFQALVDRDIEEGKRFGLNTTPTLLINNRLVSGAPPVDRFKQMIDEELRKVEKKG